MLADILEYEFTTIPSWSMLSRLLCDGPIHCMLTQNPKRPSSNQQHGMQSAVCPPCSSAQHTHTPPLPACRHTQPCRKLGFNSPVAVNACGSSGASVGTCCASRRRRTAQGCAARHQGACLQDIPRHTQPQAQKGVRNHTAVTAPLGSLHVHCLQHHRGSPHGVALPCLLTLCVHMLRHSCQQQLCWDAPQAGPGQSAAAQSPPPSAPLPYIHARSKGRSPAYDSRCSAGRMPPASLMMVRTSSTRIFGLTCATRQASRRSARVSLTPGDQLALATAARTQAAAADTRMCAGIVHTVPAAGACG